MRAGGAILYFNVIIFCALIHPIYFVFAQTGNTNGTLIVLAKKTSILVGESVQLHVTASLSSGGEIDLSSSESGTIYFTNEPGVVSVSKNGLVIGINPGKETIFVVNGNIEDPNAKFLFGEITVIIGTPNDRDGDGMPDQFETINGLNPLSAEDANQDLDRDELTNKIEFDLGTSPRNRDTDGDGLPDGEEIRVGLNPLVADFVPPFRLDENCLATVLNRTIQINSDGTFTLGNVPVPAGVFRVRVVCEQSGRVGRGQSPFVLGVSNGVTLIDEISFGVTDSLPVSLAVTAPVTALSPTVSEVQLVTTGTLPSRTLVDLTLANTGTFYTSSNPAIATVSQDGLVTAVSSGTVLVTARNEGVVGTIALKVELALDSDGDGIPDD